MPHGSWHPKPPTASRASPRALNVKGKRCWVPARRRFAALPTRGSISGRLIRHGISCPQTLVLKPGADWSLWKSAARTLGYPVVVKPRRGAGCNGVCLAPDARALRRGVEIATRANGKGSLVLQRFVAGGAGERVASCRGPPRPAADCQWTVHGGLRDLSGTTAERHRWTTPAPGVRSRPHCGPAKRFEGFTAMLALIWFSRDRRL